MSGCCCKDGIQKWLAVTCADGDDCLEMAEAVAVVKLARLLALWTDYQRSDFERIK